MEKRKAHYPLATIKALVEQGAYRVTTTALRCAAHDFGLVDVAQVADCVIGLSGQEFYKSMTTIHDSSLWQDVYRPRIGGVAAYVKVQIVSETTVVISFKALEES
jgi:motility quorum-sensing regulator/GCU-specific mRNA interferase toxin